MFNQDKKTTAVIIDEYDALISIGAKTGISEILSLLKENNINYQELKNLHLANFWVNLFKI